MERSDELQNEEEAEALYQIEGEDIAARSQIYGSAGCVIFAFTFILLFLLSAALHVDLIGNWLFVGGGFLAVFAARYFIPLYLYWKAGRWELKDGTRLRGAKARIVIYWIAVIIGVICLANLLGALLNEKT